MAAGVPDAEFARLGTPNPFPAPCEWPMDAYCDHAGHDTGGPEDRNWVGAGQCTKSLRYRH